MDTTMDYNWESLVIADDVLTRLKGICQSLRAFDTSQRQEHEPPRSLLLYGPPGTGKTRIARTLTSEVKRTHLEASPADLRTMYIGRKWRPVQDLFDKR